MSEWSKFTLKTEILYTAFTYQNITLNPTDIHSFNEWLKVNLTNKKSRVHTGVMISMDSEEKEQALRALGLK